MAGYRLHEAISRAIASPSYSDQTRWWKEVKQLLEMEADMNQRDCSCRTPLECCVGLNERLRSESESAQQCRCEAIKLLLKHGADPNLRDGRGWSSIHQAAWNDDLVFLQVCARHGKADMRTCNVDGQRAVDLAAIKNHTSIMNYLDAQSCDLMSMCRGVIRQALGKKHFQLDSLFVPPRLKLFLNCSIPYRGFSAVLVPPAPWTPEQLHRKEVGAAELRGFIQEHASEDFQSEHSRALEGGPGKEEVVVASQDGAASSEEELARLFQNMYLWEAFNNLDYEEPLARAPRYRLLPLQRDEDSGGGSS